MSAAESKASFFRQSGWMVIATVGGGAFMMVVHSVAIRMGTVEYGVFATLLKVIILLNIPASALQTIFAQQAAAAHDDDRSRELSGTVRGVLLGLFAFWLATCVFTWMLQRAIVSELKVDNPLALWLTIGLVLTSLWVPVFKGLLQGSQHFLGLGWVAIIDGVGRFTAVCVVVLILGGKAEGAVFGALVGQIIATSAGAWWTRKLWLHPRRSPDWKRWLKRVAPLTFGAGAIMVLSTADVIFVRAIYTKEESPFYIAPSMIGFALLMFTLPVAMVMFPKIVASVARSHRSDALKLTLLSTAAMGGLAALGATVLPKLPLQILYLRDANLNKHLADMALLVPWFAWGMLVLTLVNVLVNNLLARGRYAVVPWLVVIVAAYLATLLGLHGYLATLERNTAFRLIVQILTGYNLLAFGLALWFTWGKAARSGSTSSANQPETSSPR